MKLISTLEEMINIYIVDDKVVDAIDLKDDDYYAYIEPVLLEVSKELVIVYSPENAQSDLLRLVGDDIISLQVVHH